MKKNLRSIILAAVLIVIAGLLIWNNRYLSTIHGDSADFVVWDTASVTRIYLADRMDYETLLERQPDGSGWTLNKEYKAHPKEIQQILTTLYKVRVSKPVSVASHDNIVTQLASKSTKVEIYQSVPRINLFNKIKLFYHEKRTKVFYVGDATQDSSGTFMLKEGADQAYIVYIPGFRGFLTTRFTANPDVWRDHTIFHESLADIQSLTVEFGRQHESDFCVENTGRHQYKLTRLSDNADLSFDTLKVINLLSSFSDMRFEVLLNNIIPQKRIDSITGSPYFHKFTLNTKDGRSIQMTTFEKRTQDDLGNDTPDGLFTEDGLPIDPIDHDRFYGWINDGRDLVLLQYYVFGKVLNGVEYYEAGNPILYEMRHYEVLE